MNTIKFSMLTVKDIEPLALMDLLLVFFKQCLEKAPLTIVGDGIDPEICSQRCCTCIFSAENKVTGEVFNLGAGNPQTVNVARMIGGKTVSIPNRPESPNVPGQI